MVIFWYWIVLEKKTVKRAVVCQESEESGRTSVSRGFDVDYGRFYNSSYLKSTPPGGKSGSYSSRAGTVGRGADYYRRSPLMSTSSSPSHQPGVKHYHRPQQQNFSYSRRPLRTGNKGLFVTTLLQVTITLTARGRRTTLSLSLHHLVLFSQY